ncbi:hypothetical protein AAAC51_45880 [Priestia megaterium]
MIVARYIKEDTTGAHPDSYVFILKSHKNFDQICDEIFLTMTQQESKRFNKKK